MTRKLVQASLWEVWHVARPVGLQYSVKEPPRCYASSLKLYCGLPKASVLSFGQAEAKAFTCNGFAEPGASCLQMLHKTMGPTIDVPGPELSSGSKMMRWKLAFKRLLTTFYTQR